MAFKIRCEFWEMSSRGDGVESVLYDEAIGDAQEYDAATDDPVVLPVTSNRAAYAMFVYGIEGTALVEVAPTPTEDAERAHIVRLGDKEGFIINPGDKIFVAEYA